MLPSIISLPGSFGGIIPRFNSLERTFFLAMRKSEERQKVNIPCSSMAMEIVSRSPILTLSAISFLDSDMRIFIVQAGIGAEATTGVVPIVDTLKLFMIIFSLVWYRHRIWNPFPWLVTNFRWGWTTTVLKYSIPSSYSRDDCFVRSHQFVTKYFSFVHFTTGFGIDSSFHVHPSGNKSIEKVIEDGERKLLSVGVEERIREERRWFMARLCLDVSVLDFFEESDGMDWSPHHGNQILSLLMSLVYQANILKG